MALPFPAGQDPLDHVALATHLLPTHSARPLAARPPIRVPCSQSSCSGPAEGEGQRPSQRQVLD